MESGLERPGAAPAEFTRLVRDALAHLYDPAHLLMHPLNEILAPALPKVGNRAHELRVYLLDAIEHLEPPLGVGSLEKEHRPYSVLVGRYVGGQSIDEIAEELHIGPRQVRREHERGIEALAAHLWSHCHERVERGQSASPEDKSGLQSELDSLGVQLEDLSLVELITAVSEPARVLAADSGAVLVTLPGPEGLRCLCDRTLSRQALLSCLSALVDDGLQRLQISPGSVQHLPYLELSVVPPLARARSGRLDQERETWMALMSAQGGSLRLLRDERGLCHGIRLFFRPQRGSYVLVVDDNDRMLQLYGRYLAGGKYQVKVADSAQEAETLLTRAIPAAIVLDVMMRGTDGWELLQRLRSQPHLQHVPVIVCSVLEEPRLAFLLGAQAYLKKPVVAEDLLETLRRLLGESSRVGQNPAGP